MQRQYRYPTVLTLSALLLIGAFPVAHCAPASASDQDTPARTVSADSGKSSEALARDLISEGERANEATDPAGALAIFERIIKEYPDTGIAPFARLRRAETLVYLGRCDEAIASAEDLVRDHPKTLLACWAQYWIGQAWLKKGDKTRAVVEFRRVSSLVPNRGDLGPLDLSRRFLGQLCEPYLTNPKDIDKAVGFLGVIGDEARSKAEVYAILAAYVCRDGRIDLGNPVLDRLRKECPDQNEELDWATLKVACSYLDKAYADSDFNELAVGMVKPILARNTDDGAAQACLSLARFYRRNNILDKAEEVLETHKDRFLGTVHGPEILYEMGTLLRRMGKNKEAVDVFKELITKKGDSSYAVPARLLVRELGSTEDTLSFAEMITEAHKNFDPAWQQLASAPKDGRLDDPVLVARQIVAMSKEKDAFIELAFGLADRIAEKEGYSKEDVGKAKTQIVYSFLGTASALKEFWPDTAVMAYRHAERQRKAGNCNEAMQVYRAVLRQPQMQAEVCAISLYGLGLCYRELGQEEAAKQCMLRASNEYPDTEGGMRARGMLGTWRDDQ